MTATVSIMDMRQFLYDLHLQVHPNGLRHIRPDGRINQWLPPGNATVQKATSNMRQVALALTGGTVFLFELAAGGSGMLQVFFRCVLQESGTTA